MKNYTLRKTGFRCTIISVRRDYIEEYGELYSVNYITAVRDDDGKIVHFKEMVHEVRESDLPELNKGDRMYRRNTCLWYTKK